MGVTWCVNMYEWLCESRAHCVCSFSEIVALSLESEAQRMDHRVPRHGVYIALAFASMPGPIVPTMFSTIHHTPAVCVTSIYRHSYQY